MGFPGGAVAKNPTAMQQMQVRSLGQEDSLDEETATHTSILALKIPWTEEPGRLQSKRLQKVAHNWAHTHKHNNVYGVKLKNMLNLP